MKASAMAEQEPHAADRPAARLTLAAAAVGYSRIRENRAEAGLSACGSTARGTSVGDPWFSGRHATRRAGSTTVVGTRRMAARPSNGEARAGRRAGTGPTYSPPQPPGLSPVLTRNIQALQR